MSQNKRIKKYIYLRAVVSAFDTYNRKNAVSKDLVHTVSAAVAHFTKKIHLLWDV